MGSAAPPFFFGFIPPAGLDETNRASTQRERGDSTIQCTPQYIREAREHPATFMRAPTVFGKHHRCLFPHDPVLLRLLLLRGLLRTTHEHLVVSWLSTAVGCHKHCMSHGRKRHMHLPREGTVHRHPPCFKCFWPTTYGKVGNQSRVHKSWNAHDICRATRRV